MLRADLDNYKNACSELINFDILETGGITKRKGFYSSIGGDYFTKQAALFSYQASDKETYAVVMDVVKGLFTFTIYSVSRAYPQWQKTKKITTVTLSTSLAADTFYWDDTGKLDSCNEFKATQINAVLLFTHRLFPPIELGKRGESWYVQLFNFKMLPWESEEEQDQIICLTKQNNEINIIASFSYTDFRASDKIRLSYRRDEKIIQYNKEAFIQTKLGVQFLSNYTFHNILNTGIEKNAVFKKNAIVTFAKKEDRFVTEWVCISEDGFGTDFYVEGFNHPANYPKVFDRVIGKSPDTSEGEIIVDFSNFKKELAEGAATNKIKKNTVVKFREYYVTLYTCLKDYTVKTGDSYIGKTPDEIPELFVPGLLIGYEPCKGKWSFSSEGTWYGAIEIKKTYDKGNTDIEAKKWETVGSLFSKVISAVNQTISGDESDDECFVGLFLSKAIVSYWTGIGVDVNNNVPAGVPDFPSPTSMQLKIDPYKQDLIIHKRYDGPDQEVLFEPSFSKDDFWEFDGAHNYYTFNTYDWSRQAFCWLYGYPHCACLLDQRLVFAGTTNQPMTIWMSKINDIDNFDITDTDNSAINATMASNSQEPIRWMSTQRGRLLVGTSNGEYVVSSNDGGAITAKNITCIQHGFNGSENVGCAVLEDSVIYVAKGGMRAKRYGYSESADGYISTDLNIFAEHILYNKGGVRKIAAQKTPYPRVYFVMNDGTISVLAYNEKHNVLGWSRYVNCGDQGSASVRIQQRFRSLCTIELPNEDDVGVCLVDAEVSQSESQMLMNTADGEYRDGGSGRQFLEATFTTNILNSTDIGGTKRNPSEIMLYIGEDTPCDGIKLTVNNWRDTIDIPRPEGGILKKGWHAFTCKSTIEWDSVVGLKSEGNMNPLTILAMQVR